MYDAMDALKLFDVSIAPRGKFTLADATLFRSIIQEVGCQVNTFCFANIAAAMIIISEKRISTLFYR
jgi:hypothetical protein